LQDSHPAQAARLSSLVFDHKVTAADSGTILEPGQSGTPWNTVEDGVKSPVKVGV
jgi:hypothetical protein